MKKMKTKALTLMRNDTENKKSRAGPFYLNGFVRLSLFLRKVPGLNLGLPGYKYGLLDTEKWYNLHGKPWETASERDLSF